MRPSCAPNTTTAARPRAATCDPQVRRSFWRPVALTLPHARSYVSARSPEREATSRCHSNSPQTRRRKSRRSASGIRPEQAAGRARGAAPRAERVRPPLRRRAPARRARRSTCRTRTSTASRRSTRCSAASPAAPTRSAMCTNISCMLRGGYEVLAAFEKKLGLKKRRVEQGVHARRGGVHRGVRERAVRRRRHEVLPRPHARPGRRTIIDELDATPHPESEVRVMPTRSRHQARHRALRQRRRAHARRLREDRRLPGRCARRSRCAPRTSPTEVKASNLRGRGGAGFATGVKWGFVPQGRQDRPPRLQRRRVRARHLQGPRADVLGSAPPDRGHGDRRARARARCTTTSTSAAR